MPARIPPQTPPPRGIQPPPNFKNISRSFAKSFPQKIVFAKPRPFFRTAHFLPFEPFGALRASLFSFGETVCIHRRAEHARGPLEVPLNFLLNKVVRDHIN